MKKRILSLVLCAAMLLSMCLFLGAGVTNSLTVCDSSGEAVKRVDLPVNQKISLTAQAQSAAENDAYQWQIRAAKNVWANILGSDTQTLELSYPMVASALSEKNTVQIRCRLTSAETGEATFSDAVTVEVTAATAVDTPASADAAAAPVLRSPAKAAAAANNAPETCTIEIKYEFENGTQAAPSWTAKVAKGSDYSATITSPAVVGYAADQETVEIDVKGIQKDETFYVTYKPALVDFTVKYYQQNVGDDKYSLFETKTKQGYTEKPVSEYETGENGFAANYDGFTRLLYDDTATIAADGSTVVELYYDRNYYLMNFDLDGGYGVEPIYARYGATINVGTPTKPGYSFDKWKPTLPKTMPVVSKNAQPYKATWNVGKADFTVVFWYENANDNGYSVAGIYKPGNVATGTEKKSEDYKNQSFKDQDDAHFTYNAAKAETVSVKGDGSTVLNVYFTRNTYTLTFPECGAKTLSCGKVEHEHTPELCCNSTHSIMGHHTGYGFDGTCNAKNCPVGYEHTHSDSCYKNSDLTITAKYDSDITSVWNEDPIKSLLDQGYVFQSSVTDDYYSFLEKMPGQNVTMKKTLWSGYVHKMYYYLEIPSGMSAPTGAATKTNGGKNYYLYHTTTLMGSSDVYLTYDEDYFPITGYTQRDDYVPSYTWNRSEQCYQAYLYYTRDTYDLKFVNYGTVAKTATKYYQADISHEGFIPDCPDTLEANAYRFDGWYTDQFFSENGKFDFTGATMPAGPVVLYAHWVPVTHTVKTYLTENDLNGVALKEWTVSHGTAVPENDPPVTPENGNYTFVGWFYKDANGTEHAFDFSMPVTKDLNLYAKWSSNTLVKYTIKYAVRNKDGTLTYIADDTKGSALALTTKTFEAKTGDQLNEGYQSGYFPETSSHSIIMDIEDPEKNVYTFVYVPKQEVNYTVRYLDKATGDPVLVNGQPTPDKTATTSNAVVTVTFKQITGYAPDAYQKRLVLSANDKENVLVFWYTKDEVHAPVQIVHEIQNIEGDKYTEYQSSTNLNGVIGDDYKGTPLTIPGFKYNESASTASGKLTEAGLVLTLKYDRIEYPYEFRFLEQGTDKQLAAPAKGTARYQAQVTRKAETIPGYTLVSAENQAINIAIEDPADKPNKNVKIFYYTEQTVDIKYQVVGPDGSGTLNNYQETQLKVLNGTANGSTPTPNAGYKFVGWYKDEGCTQQVDKTWVNTDTNKLTPLKSVPYGNQEGYRAATYYAKFERDVFDLQITKHVTGKGANPNQTFVFTVKDEANETVSTIVLKNGETKTIKGLPVGTYTVTEDTAWSWQYKPDEVTKNVKINGTTAEVTFTNTYSKSNWLTSFAEVINKWVNGVKKIEQVNVKN